MNYLLSMLAVLVTGMIVLMVGILITREPEQSFKSALNESLAWGTALFLSFGAGSLTFAIV